MPLCMSSLSKARISRAHQTLLVLVRVTSPVSEVGYLDEIEPTAVDPLDIRFLESESRV
jgi:hypothetical protein